MHIQHPAPAMTSDTGVDDTPASTAAVRSLESLSVRELLGELAETDAVLRQRPDEEVRSTTLQGQLLIVVELRRRRRRHGLDRSRQRSMPMAPDPGAPGR